MGGLFSWLLGGRGNSHNNMSLREWEEAFDAADRVDVTDASYTLGNKLFDANGVEIEKPASEVFNFSNDILITLLKSFRSKLLKSIKNI